jgi:hypothetical protein
MWGLSFLTLIEEKETLRGAAFESGMSGVPGVSGVSGRCVPDGSRVYMGLCTGGVKYFSCSMRAKGRARSALYKLVGEANHILPDSPDTPDCPDTPDSKVVF